MRGIWTENDIECGTMVSAPTDNGKYRVPCIIGYNPSTPNTQYGLIDLRDGMFMKFGDGSKEALAAQLNKGGHVPVLKATFKGSHHQMECVENRLQLPVVIITNSGG